jgi:hypothetical protein
MNSARSPFQTEWSAHTARKAFDNYTHDLGWIRDPAHVEQLIASLPTKTIYNQGIIRGATTGPLETCLWDAEFAVTGRVRDAHNQLSVGICTGEAWTGAGEDTEFIQIAKGSPDEFQWLCSEFLYGGGRVTIGQSQIGGDGAATSWLGQYGLQYGFLPRKNYAPNGPDMTNYSEEHARYYGDMGVPPALLSEQRLHVFKAIAPCRDVQTAIDALMNWYPIVAGSSQGFEGKRDADGCIAPRGSWSHCTYYRGGIFYGRRPRVFYQQSWGKMCSSVGSGEPMTITLDSGRPVTLPMGCFGVDLDVFEKRILSAEDAWILSGEDGFYSLDYKLY